MRWARKVNECGAMQCDDLKYLNLFLKMRIFKIKGSLKVL